MARADLIVRLVKSASQGDQALFRRTVEALVAEERAKQHHILASRLEEVLPGAEQRRGDDRSRLLFSRGASNDHLIEVVPDRPLDSMTLPASIRAQIIELIEEQHRVELLRAYGLEPRHRLLLVGPPGNGKTTVAEALATELMTPMFVVRYETVVASYLGETSSRLQKLFDHVRNHHCVLFFDEFDTLAKERGDLHETGEIKRVVSTLLLQVDKLPSHVVVIAATNHPELLDRAAWRRFQLRLELPPPNLETRFSWLESFSRQHNFTWSEPTQMLAADLEGASFSEMEDLALDLLRRRILAGPQADEHSIVRRRINQWRKQQAAESLSAGRMNG